MRVYKIFLLLTIMSFSWLEVSGQQNHTMYAMRNLAQAQYENPAFQPRGKSYFAFGVGHHSIGANFSGFTLNDALTTRTQDDSLVIDQENILAKLAKRNYFLIDSRNELVGFSFNFTESYWGFYITHRLSNMFYYPKDLLSFAIEGNGRSLLGNRAEIGGLGMKLDGYMEYGLAYGRPIGDKWRVGGKIKLLSGYANFNSKNSKLGIHTDENDFALTLDGQMKFHSSGLGFLFDSTGIEGWDVNPMLMFNFRNIGVSMDLGFTYDFTEKLELSGSLLDLGFIRWKNDVNNYKTDNLDFFFEGVDMNKFLNDSTNYTDRLVDSLLEKVENDLTDERYTTMLSSKFYIGLKYSPKNWLHLGLTSYNQIVANKIRPAVIASATLMASDFVALTTNYSYYGRKFGNVGLGFSIRFGAIQLHAMTDNILALNTWKAKNVHVSAGLNLMFGEYKKKKEIPTKGVKWVDIESGKEVPEAL